MRRAHPAPCGGLSYCARIPCLGPRMNHEYACHYGLQGSDIAFLFMDMSGAILIYLFCQLVYGCPASLQIKCRRCLMAASMYMIRGGSRHLPSRLDLRKLTRIVCSRARTTNCFSGSEVIFMQLAYVADTRRHATPPGCYLDLAFAIDNEVSSPSIRESVGSRSTTIGTRDIVCSHISSAACLSPG
jgi:hypothetical protein